MTQGNGIVYQREDLETLSLSRNSFDLVYSSLALHYLHDIERLFVTIYQSLTPGGMLVFSAEHPIYTAPLNQAGSKIKPGNSPGRLIIISRKVSASVTGLLRASKNSIVSWRPGLMR